jgi:type IV secretory pathway TrbD component
MAAEERDAELRDGELIPPPSEQIHLPGPSFLPVMLAFGITLALVGVVLTWVVFGIGFVIFLVALIRWIRETRADISELPLEH